VLWPDRGGAVLRGAATPAFGPAEDNDCDFWDRALVSGASWAPDDVRLQLGEGAHRPP